MRIAIDYDNTISADPVLWFLFAIAARGRGHDVRIVTARDERFDRTAPLVSVESWDFPIIWTRGMAKRWHCEHFHGWLPDVWIDDKPEAILANSTTSPAALDEWRTGRGEGPVLPLNFG